MWNAVALCIPSQGPGVPLAAFMATDTLYWFPIHSLELMFDQLHCRLPAHS